MRRTGIIGRDQARTAADDVVDLASLGGVQAKVADVYFDPLAD